MNLRICTLLIALIAICVTLTINFYMNQVQKAPDLDLEKWWGADPRPKQEDVSVRPFTIEINETVILDLRERLRNRRPLTRNLEGIQSEYGINTVFLEKVLNYWSEKYDLKQRADMWNKFPHYKTRIQGLDIHFIRVKPQRKDGLKVLPILLMHGWPSSSKEFHKLIPMIATPKDGYDFIFEVVAVDLPGFGFSEGTNKPGLNPVQIAIIIRNLMKRLGYEKFYIQAGDWGSQCATHMSTLFPNEILGFHSNMPISSTTISMVKLLLGSLFPSLIVEDKYSERIYPLSNFFQYLVRESGYFHIQATKPDTIGVGLTDSPAGLAAYMIEKMAICNNREQLDTPHGGLESLNLDDVLDTVTITWINNCIVTSMRIYAEGLGGAEEIAMLHKIPTKVPMAAINFRYEVMYQPDSVLRDKFHNLVRSTTLDSGGHFAALEVPGILAGDVFDSVREFLKFHANNKRL